MKQKIKNVGRIIAIAAICFAALATTALPVQAVPGTPVGVYGFVSLSDGTQAPLGTSVSVNDITSGFYEETTTGYYGSYCPDLYLVIINEGGDGDTVIVKAWSETHYGETTVILKDVMRVDLVMDTPY